MTAVVLASPGPLFIDPHRQVVQSNSTITATGSAQFSGFGVRELVLVINLTIAPTGSSPTITFSMQEIDPGNGTTTLGSSVTGATLNSATTQILTLPLTLTGAVQVTWTITGGSASFTGVYATLLSRSTTVLSALDVSNNEHAVLVDSTGRTLIVGAGTAGTPTGGVISIQGVSGGFAIPISGTVTASNASIGLTGSAIPASATLIGASDGTNLIALKIKGASTAAVAADPSLVVAFSPNSPLPTGAAVIGAVTQSGSWTTTVTQATASNLNAAVVGVGTAGTPSGGVVSVQGVSSGQALPVSLSGTVTVIGDAASGSPVAGNPVLVAGSDGTAARTLSTDASGHAVIVGDGTAGSPAGGVVSVQGVSSGQALPVSLSGTVTVVGDAASGSPVAGNPILVAGSDGTNARSILTDTSGRPVVNQGVAAALSSAWSAKITDGTNGPAAVKAASTQSAAADPALVVALSPGSAQTRASTGTTTGVASSASSVTILAANSARLGAIITNSSTAILYLRYSATAAAISSGNYTVSVAITLGTHEVPFGYTGAITGIWASANGFANVTEITV